MDAATIDQLLETWAIHNRINLYLLKNLPEGGLGAALAPKGRTVARQFAHMHTVRLMWLKAAAPDLMAGVEKLDPEADMDQPTLTAALTASGDAIAQLLRQAFAAGKVKNFKPHPAAFLGYMISHESHHRGQIGWTLKHAGMPLDKKVAYGIWEWGVR